MRFRPARPARSRKTQYIVVALVVALVAVLCVTGFVWAQKPVQVVVDGRSTATKTQARDVADVLDELGVSVGRCDVVAPSATTRLTPGMTVTVRHAVPVTLSIDGRDTELAVVGRTVADALTAAGLDPAANLAVKPSLTAELEPGMVITAPDAFVRVEQERRSVPFKTIVRKDPHRAAGERVVLREGTPGVELRVWRTVVTGGQEGDRTLSAAAVVEEARPRVVAVGAARGIAQLVHVSQRATASGKRPTNGRRVDMRCTGYTAGEPGGTTATSTGTRVSHGVIATDPDVIPMGTRLYVPGYGYGVAADVGGMINGNHIDLYFDTVAEMDAWGSRMVTVTILD